MPHNEQNVVFIGITENRSRIMAVIIASVRDFDLADDLFQQTVVELLESSEHFDSTREFFPWACGVARNVIKRHWSKAKNAPVLATQDILDSFGEIAADDVDNDVWRVERAALHECLKKLPKRMRKLFILRYGMNLKGGKLAARSGVSEGSLRTTLARLRRSLRHCIVSRVERFE